MSPRLNTLLASGAFLLGVAGGAAAQTQPAQPAQPMERHEQRVMMIQHHQRDPAEHLRALLQLRPEQEPALQAFLAAGKPDHDRMFKMDGPGEPKTTPERLALMEQHMGEMQAAMRAHMDATRRFYDQLDPAQKRAFDEMPMLIGGPHMGMEPMPIVMHRMPMPPLPPMPPMPPEPGV